MFGVDGTVYAVDVDRGVIWQMSGGEASVAATPGAGPNGMALETPTSAVVANNGGFLWTEVNGFRIPIDFTTHTNEPPGFAGGWIERVDLVTGDVTVLHRDCEGRPLRGPNDLVFDELGGIWFTDHGKGRRETVDRGGLYYVPPDGSGVVEKAFPLLGPNGVGLSPDGRHVYAAETHTGRLWSWELADAGEIRPRSGNLAVRHGGTCVGRHALLVRLARGGGGRPDRRRRHRGRCRGASRRTGRRPRSTRFRATSPRTSPSAAPTAGEPCSPSHGRAGWSRLNGRGRD